MPSFARAGLCPRWALPAWALLAAFTPAVCQAQVQGARTGLARIAVAGAHPTGYLGLLARYGMPRDVVLDYRLAEPEALSDCDLLIVAGFSPGIRSAFPAMERMLARGASILFDYSIPQAVVVPPALARRAGGLMPLLAAATRPPAAFRLVGDGNPLHPDVGTQDTFPPARFSLVPAVTDPQNTTVLAEYVRPAPRNPQRRLRFPEVASPWDGRQAPAILLVRQGAGKLILCGPGIAAATALQGLDYDRLMLGMIRILTDGRAVPQLEPEGPRLGRKQSSRSLQRQGSAGEPEQDAEAGDDLAQALLVRDRRAGPGRPGPLPAGWSLLEADPAAEYNVSGELAGPRAELLLNYWNAAHCLRVVLAADGIRILRTASGKTQTLVYARARLEPRTRFVVKERGARLIVVAGQTAASADIAGVWRGQVATRGALSDVRYQPVEPAFFSDDFMRTSDESGGWEAHGGAWETAPVRNPDLGANPFSYRVRAENEAAALAGFPYWDEYRFSVSARPEAGSGAIGCGLYVQDARNMLLFRARVRAPDRPLDDGFALVRLQGGNAQVVASRPGGLLPDQWYRLEVKAEGPWVGAFVDGERVLAARDTTWTGGRIALWADHASARFDDVLVEPSALRREPGQQLVAKVPAFAGVIDVASWAGPATLWEPDVRVPGLFWHRGHFLGDVGMRFGVPLLPDGASIALVVGGDETDPTSGWTLQLSRAGSGGVLELQHAGKTLQRTRTRPGEAALGLRRERGRILGLLDGRVVLQASDPRGAGTRLAFRAVGFRPRVSRVTLWSANVHDDTFDRAPTDWWIGSGEWDVTNRWSCTPDWSWFGGYSEGVAVIWHKRPFAGDVVLDFYAGPKMIETGQRPREQLADFNAVLCGDGRNVESGYTFLVAPGGRGARILRQGRVVAEHPEFRLFAQGHNRWASIRAEKLGATLRLVVEGHPVLQWEDPDPLPGGHVGIWTRNNGIMVPRITVYHEKEVGPPLSLRRLLEPAGVLALQHETPAHALPAGTRGAS